MQQLNAIDLQRPELLPENLRKGLDSIESACRNEEYSEELVKIPSILELVKKIDEYCFDKRVVGIHYTRAIRADIEQKGLLTRTGRAIREEFLCRFGSLFDKEEIEWLENKWSSHQAEQSDIRDSMLWFNFTMQSHGGPGTDYLLGMYGGEQVHIGIEPTSSIGSKLAQIGEPLLVKCALYPKKVKNFIEHPWGKILVSSFHLSIEPKACRIDQDGRVMESIMPKDLIVESTG